MDVALGGPEQNQLKVLEDAVAVLGQENRKLIDQAHDMGARLQASQTTSAQYEERLNRTLEASERQRVEHHTTVANLETIARDLRSQNDKLSTDLSEVRSRVALSEAKNATMSKKLHEHENHVCEVEQKMDALLAANASLTDDLAELQSEADKIALWQVSCDWMTRFAIKHSIHSGRGTDVQSLDWLDRRMERGDSEGCHAHKAFARVSDEHFGRDLRLVLKTLTEGSRDHARPTKVKTDEELKRLASSVYPKLAKEISALIDWRP